MFLLILKLIYLSATNLKNLQVSHLFSAHLSAPRCFGFGLTLQTAHSYSAISLRSTAFSSSKAGLAQLVERLIRNQKVAGSTPAAGSNGINN